MTPVLKIENLHVYYGGSHVLQGVNLELENGVAAIIGRNGMGKTTMANAIMGLVPTREGKVFINGDCITGKQPYEIARKGIGYVPQGRKIFPSLSVDEHLRFAERPVENGWDAERVYEFFPRLKERYKQSGTNLSGGEQQRVSIARALAKNPKLLLCDEPTGALDYNTGKAILKLLQDMCRERGMTVILITHNSAITPMADRVIKMKNGKVGSMKLNERPVPVETIEW